MGFVGWSDWGFKKFWDSYAVLTKQKIRILNWYSIKNKINEMPSPMRKKREGTLLEKLENRGPNSALYQRLNRTRNKHNEDHDTILTLADFAKNVLGVTVKVSNQTLNQENALQQQLQKVIRQG